MDHVSTALEEVEIVEPSPELVHLAGRMNSDETPHNEQGGRIESSDCSTLTSNLPTDASSGRAEPSSLPADDEHEDD
jgi:hypothetical protein